MKCLSCFVVLSFTLTVALAKTQCEAHRERELKSNIFEKVVPECNEYGDYKALQCFVGLPICMCWRPDGSVITKPSKKIQTCTCHVHRDTELRKSEQGMVGNFVPRCEESGFYSKKQCLESTGYCWCVDMNGNSVSKPVREDPIC